MDNNFNFKIYAVGLGVVCVLLVMMTFIVTLLLHFTTVSENILPRIGVILQSAAVCIGSLMAALKANSKGLIYGGAISCTVISIVLIGRYFTNGSFTLDVFNCFCLLLAGVLGGLIGIGLSE